MLFSNASGTHMFKLSRLGYWKVEMSIMSQKYVFICGGRKALGPRVQAKSATPKNSLGQRTQPTQTRKMY